MRQCGSWTLGREIGRGAYGVVHFATGPRGETAAVKVCVRDDAAPERFERELRGAKSYARIPPGEGLVRLLELGECEWGFYAAMELADDEFGVRPAEEQAYSPKTLSRVVAGEKALPVEEALELGIALAKGLATLQSRHLLHRDVKPGNVVYVRGRPALSDFGLLVDEAEASSLVGTPGYVPPENFVGAGGDVYCLGLTLKAASFGRPVEELAKGPTLEADTGNPLFAAWWRVLNKATHPDASRRYRSAKALLKDLRLLRVKLLFGAKAFGLPRFAWILAFAAAVLAGLAAFRIKSSADESAARWREQDEFLARETARQVERANEAVRAVDAMADRLRKSLQGAKRGIPDVP